MNDKKARELLSREIKALRAENERLYAKYRALVEACQKARDCAPGELNNKLHAISDALDALQESGGENEAR